MSQSEKTPIIVGPARPVDLFRAASLDFAPPWPFLLPLEVDFETLLKCDTAEWTHDSTDIVNRFPLCSSSQCSPKLPSLATLSPVFAFSPPFCSLTSCPSSLCLLLSSLP